MFEFSVKDKTYKIAYTYRTLAESTALDGDSKNTVSGRISEIAELLLTGMQVHHYGEFPCDTDSRKKKSLDKIFVLMEEYEEESTEDVPKNVFDLHKQMNDELLKKGFFAKLKQAEVEARAKLVQEVIEAGKKNM